MATVADSPALADYTRVRVWYLKAPNEMFLQRVDDDDAIRQMLLAVDLAAETARPLSEPRVCQPCLAFVRNFSGVIYSAGTALWCKVVVETVLSPNVTLLLLDFGKVVSMKVCPWSLRRMSADLDQIPLMVRRLHAPVSFRTARASVRWTQFPLQEAFLERALTLCRVQETSAC